MTMSADVSLSQAGILSKPYDHVRCRGVSAYLSLTSRHSVSTI